MSTRQSMTLQDRNRDGELAFLFRETRNPDHFAEICERNRLRLDALLRTHFHFCPILDYAAVIAETFEDFYAFLSSDQRLTNVNAWLSTRAKHRAMETLRWERRQKRGGKMTRKSLEGERKSDGKRHASVAFELIDDRQPTGLDQLLQDEKLHLLHEAIATLSNQARSVVLLKLQRLSDEQIGRRLGIREGTVKSRYHNAKERLRELLREEVWG
jgi:RNA polymerase sigma factor (sigma-70 family)